MNPYMENTFQINFDFIWIIMPLLVLQITLMIIGLWEWLKKRESLKRNKILWLFVIIFLNTIGPIVFLYYSRRILVITPSDVDEWEE